MTRAYLLGSAALVWAAAGAVQAQEAIAPTPGPTEVVVTATRFATYRGDADFSHVDLTHADLADAPVIDEALKTDAQASLFRRNSSLSANPTVQGISLRAIGPNGAGRALVTLDGIPQNDPFGNWVIWAGLPQGAVDHVHVLRGAGGGAYGAGGPDRGHRPRPGSAATGRRLWPVGDRRGRQ